MRAFLITIALIAVVPTGFAQSTGSDARTGEHPSIAARRVIAQQGYDYASKFYPHPAWLHLSAQPPRPMSDHPAVLVFRQAQEQQRASLESARQHLAER
jgi:hypothetical protein